MLDSTQRILTPDIYQVLIRNEFDINENFKLRIESVHDGFSLPSILEFTHYKVVPVCVRSHRIEYSEIEEAKVKLSSPLCKQCGEPKAQTEPNYSAEYSVDSKFRLRLTETEFSFCLIWLRPNWITKVRFKLM